MYKFLIHYGLHFLFTAIIAFVFYRDKWKRVYLIFIITMLIDLDHLLANPVFDAHRCSINFHPLHTYYAIIIYFLALFHKKTHIIALGLLLHMLADFVDCYL